MSTKAFLLIQIFLKKNLNRYCQSLDSIVMKIHCFQGFHLLILLLRQINLRTILIYEIKKIIFTSILYKLAYYYKNYLP